MPTTYAIPNGRTVFNATLYTGNGTAVTVNNSENGSSGFKPDLVWGKSRSNALNHCLIDSVRGVSKSVFTDTTDPEVSAAGYYVTAFNSNGFDVGLGTGLNTNGATYVAWNWQAGQGTNTTNTSGSLTSTVSVNQTAGFSIVSYTGNGSPPQTIGHGLGVAPQFIMIKDRAVSSNWIVQHNSLGWTQGFLGIATIAASTSSAFSNNTAPTSSVFTVGAYSNNNGEGYIAYCWAPVAGFSQFGSYSGNGSSNGPFIYTGFRPKYVLIKRSDSSAGRWDTSDTSRNPYNYVTQWLYSEYNYAEDNAGELYDFLSNGFKLRNNGTGTNASGGSYIYMAWAENPFKYANAR